MNSVYTPTYPIAADLIGVGMFLAERLTTMQPADVKAACDNIMALADQVAHLERCAVVHPLAQEARPC